MSARERLPAMFVLFLLNMSGSVSISGATTTQTLLESPYRGKLARLDPLVEARCVDPLAQGSFSHRPTFSIATPSTEALLSRAK